MPESYWGGKSALIGITLTFVLGLGFFLGRLELSERHKPIPDTPEACEKGDLHHCETLPTVLDPVTGTPRPADAYDKSNRDEYRSEKDLQAQRRMADWALGMMILTGLGVGLLFATWIETGRVTIETRKIGEAQVRAYLACINLELCIGKHGDFAQTRVQVRNYGQSPASDVQAILRVNFLQRSPDPDITSWFEMEFGNVAAGHSPAEETHFAIQKEEDLARVQLSSPVQARVDLVLYWRDVFDREHFERRYFHKIWAIPGSSTNLSKFEDSSPRLGGKYWKDLLPRFHGRREKHHKTYND